MNGSKARQICDSREDIDSTRYTEKRNFGTVVVINMEISEGW